MIIGFIVSILLAALAYWLVIALGLPSIVAIIAAILVLLAGLPMSYHRLGGKDLGRR